LAPATLEYHVVVANASIALNGAYTYENDSVVAYYETPGASAQEPSYHGGLALALQSMFMSNVSISFGGAVGMRISTSGVTGLAIPATKGARVDEGVHGVPQLLARSGPRRADGSARGRVLSRLPDQRDWRCGSGDGPSSCQPRSYTGPTTCSSAWR